jgi:hypothetical protein
VSWIQGLQAGGTYVVAAVTGIAVVVSSRSVTRTLASQKSLAYDEWLWARRADVYVELMAEALRVQRSLDSTENGAAAPDPQVAAAEAEARLVSVGDLLSARVNVFAEPEVIAKYFAYIEAEAQAAKSWKAASRQPGPNIPTAIRLNQRAGEAAMALRSEITVRLGANRPLGMSNDI